MNFKNLPIAKLTKLNLLPDFQAIHHLVLFYLTSYFPPLFTRQLSPHWLSPSTPLHNALLILASPLPCCLQCFSSHSHFHFSTSFQA